MIVGGGHTLYDSRPSAEAPVPEVTAPETPKQTAVDDILGDLPTGKETAWNKF
jgi:hypothetical protein